MQAKKERNKNENNWEEPQENLGYRYHIEIHVMVVSEREERRQGRRRNIEQNYCRKLPKCIEKYFTHPGSSTRSKEDKLKKIRQNEDKIETFPDKQKLRESVTSQLVLQEIWKEVHQAENSWHQTVIQIHTLTERVPINIIM